MSGSEDAFRGGGVSGFRYPRGSIPALVTSKGLRGTGVEIGVELGEFSDRLLRETELSRVFSIDPWEYQDGYMDISNVDNNQQNRRYVNTVVKLSVYGTRSVCMRMYSSEAGKMFSDSSIDVVYIDANHSFGSCSQDLSVWWPLISPGGIFSGHDYIDGVFEFGTFGVKSAVDAFAKERNLEVHVLQDGLFPSWCIFKG